MTTATPEVAAAKNFSILAWITKQEIKNEKGDPIDIKSHRFLQAILADRAQNLVVMKAAQVGMSTAEILRNHFAAKHQKLDIIYTLPTDNDVRVFVGGKVNRIIANNPCMLVDVADKDSIEQKQVGASMIYFRGTWTKKAAIMVTADRLAHDEKDSSKLDVIADYQARLQHSKYKQTHIFSHPSLPETGVHSDWLKSDQKHWFITCEHCGFEQFLNWNTEDPNKMSVDIDRRIFVCKKCGGEIPDHVRANGRWKAKFPEKRISGYWVPWFIAPWVSAADIVAKWQEVLDGNQTPDFFHNKVLGLPYADGTAKLLRKDFIQNLTGKTWAPGKNERVVIGIDTGLRLDYVIGNKNGLFYHGDCNDYDELDRHMQRWTKAIAIVDQGGDLVGSRKFAQRWPGRVWLCSLAGDRKTKELVKWGKGDEDGQCTADRNRMIQLVVGEFRAKRITIHGNENEWHEYYLDWKNLSRIKALDAETNQVKGYKWVRSGRDHRAMATIFWRVGMRRFAGSAVLIAGEESEQKPNSYMINPDQTVGFDPERTFKFPGMVDKEGIEASLDALEESDLFY